MPNNPISTPLPADLPVNWQTGQIVAPNGADVGLSPQHGYNYLMQQLNAAQQAGNTLGAAIAALKGSDIPTSGSDSTDLATALSNKAEKGSPQEYSLPLSEGWEYEHTWDKNCYCKTQENLVIVHFSARNRSAVDPGDHGYVLGYLPEGFHPSAAIIGVCGDYNYDGTSIYHFWIHPSGTIVIYSPEKAPVGASGTLVFVAG